MVLEWEQNPISTQQDNHSVICGQTTIKHCFRRLIASNRNKLIINYVVTINRRPKFYLWDCSIHWVVIAQLARVYTCAACLTEMGKTNFMLWGKKYIKQYKLGCQLALTSATEVLNVALLKNSMNLRARIPQSYL